MSVSSRGAERSAGWTRESSKREAGRANCSRRSNGVSQTSTCRTSNYGVLARPRPISRTRTTPSTPGAAIREMHRQVGPLPLDADVLATRGLIIRHLVMPGMLEETRSILEWIARELGPDAYVNPVDQYCPASNVSTSHYGEISRRLDGSEFARAKTLARELDLTRPDERRPSRKLQARRRITRWGDPRPADSLPPTHYGPSSGRPAKLQALKPPMRLYTLVYPSRTSAAAAFSLMGPVLQYNTILASLSAGSWSRLASISL